MSDSSGKSDTRSLVSSVLSRVSGDKSEPPTEDPPAAPAAPATGEAPSLPTESPVSGDISALAGSVLAKLGGPSEQSAAEEPPPETAPGGLSEEDQEALIEVYFELEEPEERDALFDQLVTVRSPIVDEFLRAMMEEDEDEYVRAAAAAEMARRGDRDALARLEGDLEDPEESFFFEHAVQVLGEVHGVGFYERLSAIWKDEERDGDQRREVMLGMEALDLERALADFRNMIDQCRDIDAMPDDQVEVALMAFLRHGYSDALPSLEALVERIRTAPIDPEEKVELVDFVKEGMAQLRAQGD